MTLDTSENLLLEYVDKDNSSSTASAWGIKWCICPCEVGTKITYGGSNFQLSVYKLHKRGQQLFFFILC